MSTSKCDVFFNHGPGVAESLSPHPDSVPLPISRLYSPLCDDGALGMVALCTHDDGDRCRGSSLSRLVPRGDVDYKMVTGLFRPGISGCPPGSFDGGTR